MGGGRRPPPSPPEWLSCGRKSSVDGGGNPAEQKNGFCHTSRTSNGINVGVSAERRLIAWRASQHANVMHGRLSGL